MSDVGPSSSASCPHTGLQPSAEPAGGPVTMAQSVLETGAATLQSFAPVKQFHAHLCALHAYADDIATQIIAHHYCCHLTAEVHQCVLFDSSEKGAKLIGVEYLISERLYESLDADEKKLWHSHKYEVQSGMLSMPRLPEVAERPLMQEIANMYGKIIETWPNSLSQLPLGPPRLMVSVTSDAEVDKALWQRKDEETGCDSAKRAEARTTLDVRPRLPGCDVHDDDKLIRFETKVFTQ